MSGFFSSIKRATSASFDGQGCSGEYECPMIFLSSLTPIKSVNFLRLLLLRYCFGGYFDSRRNVINSFMNVT